MARIFVELAHLLGVAGVDAKPVAEGKRVRFTLAIHPDPKSTRWVTCFGSLYPEAVAVKSGDRLEVRGYWSGDNEVNLTEVTIVQTKADIEAKREAAKRAKGNAPSPEWKEDQQLQMQEQPPQEEELPL
jgi:hypothetical protein